MPVCTAQTVEPAMEPCGLCNSGVRRRSRTCAADGCSWGAWSEWSECAFEIGIRLFGIEPGAGRTLGATPHQMVPEHRLEFFRPIVSLKSHFRNYFLNDKLT